MRRLILLLAGAFALGFLLAGAVAAQTVTLAGDSAKISFGVTVPRVHDTTTVTKIVTDTLRVPYAVHDTVTLQPPILRADTTVATRVSGDTTFTVRQIVTLRGIVDTVRATSFVVAVHVLRPDSVLISAPKVLSTDTTKLVLNIYTYPKVTGSVTARWLYNGVQVATSSQIGFATTVRIPRPGVSTSIVACAKRTGDAAETCSAPRLWTVGVSSAPPADTTHYLGSLTSLAVGYARALSPRVLPIWAQFTGSPLRVMVRDSASGWNVDFMVPPATVGPIPAELAAIGHPVGTIPLPAGPLVLTACAEVPATDSLVFRLCTPPARLP